ncbi:MAG: SLC13 family permease [Lachnospiraceae bacterium]
MQKLKAFCKKEIVLLVSLLLAIGTAFVVRPDKQYIGYLDFRILAILFSLMAVMAGMTGIGVFHKLAAGLLNRMGNLRQVIAILVLLCFFTAMFITNDVALITFVPFAILVLKMSGQQKYMIRVLVLQTIAANLGSMVTPIGNPQNLYLYSLSGMHIWGFFKVMLPYTVASLIMLLIFLGFQTKQSIRGLQLEEGALQHGKRFPVYLGLFLCCILAVLDIMPYQILFVLVLITVGIMDRKALAKVDYSLLLTFAFLFIFTGNMARIPAIRELLTGLLTGREWEITLLLSQVISNVPAAILLSGFTDKYTAIMVGADLGGLGTLIGSMASLIAYKLYANEADAKKGKFIGVLFLYSIIFLIPLALMAGFMVY